MRNRQRNHRFLYTAGTSNPAEQGVVINVHTLPGGSLTRFNQGKTLVHETGHYLNLMHIWAMIMAGVLAPTSLMIRPTRQDHLRA
jgi:hypothetical protein